MKKQQESLDYCEKDYKHRHYWELVGNHSYYYLIYRCTQCLKSKIVQIEYLKGNHTETYDYKKWGSK